MAFACMCLTENNMSTLLLATTQAPTLDLVTDLHVELFPSGARRAEGPLVAGRRHGLWRTWHPGGQFSEEALYQDGQRHGPFRAWHADGTLWSEGEYVHGRLHRDWRCYWPSGVVAIAGAYEAGRAVGQWTYTDQRGEPLRQVDHTAVH